ncbi:MAG: mechanosensitive ion channel [Longimicrobiales bacterium]
MSPLRALFAALLLLGLPACFGADPDASGPDAGATADTVAVQTPPPVDSLGGLQAAVDSLAALPGLDDATLERLLLQVVVGQMALERRIDSLRTRLTARADGPRPDRLVDAAGDTAVGVGVGAFWTVVVLGLNWLSINALIWLLDALAERYPRSRLFWKRLAPGLRIFFWGVAVFFTLRFIWEVDADGLLAAGAAVGVAVGFAAQDLLKNLFGGLILVFDQPFQVGDKISVGGTYGEVVSVGIRSTRIVTPDDNLVSVPNAQVVDGQVANANAGELNCQVVTDLYLPGTVHEARAKKIAFDAAASSKYVFLNKPITVLVKDEFKETFLTRIRVKAYVLDPRYEFLFQSDVTERARAGFREAGLMTPNMALRAWLDLSQTAGPGGTPPPGTDPEGTNVATAPEEPAVPLEDLAGGDADG